MGQTKNHLAFFVVVQSFVFLLAVGVYPQHDEELMGWWQFDEGVGSFVGDDITGDKKYLGPLQRHLDWAKSLPEGKRGWCNYDFETGEPIVAVNRRMIAVGSSEYEELMESGVRVNYPRGGNRVPFLQNALEARQAGPLVPAWSGTISRAHFVKQAVPTAELDRLLSERTAQAMDSLDRLENWRDGHLQPGGVLENMSRSGPTLTVGEGCNFALDVLDLLQIVQPAIGEAELESIPLYLAPLAAARTQLSTTPLGVSGDSRST